MSIFFFVKWDLLGRAVGTFWEGCSEVGWRLRHVLRRYHHLEGGQTAVFNRRDLHHKAPDSGERQYESRALKM